MAVIDCRRTAILATECWRLAMIRRRAGRLVAAVPVLLVLTLTAGCATGDDGPPPGAALESVGPQLPVGPSAVGNGAAGYPASAPATGPAMADPVPSIQDAM